MYYKKVKIKKYFINIVSNNQLKYIKDLHRKD